MSSFFSQLPIGTAVGYGVGGAAQSAIRPLIQDLVNEAWSLHPSLPADVAAAAQLVAERKRPRDWGANEARMNGVNGERFDALVELARQTPAIGELLALHARGSIGDDALAAALRANGLADQWIDPVITLARQYVSPAALANMVVRGVITQQQGRDQAAKSSVVAEDFDRLVQLTGNPPGIEQVLTLWNRGQATEADVDQAMRQSDLKPEWFDLVKQLRFIRPSVSDEIRFAVRDVYTPATASRYRLLEGFPEEFAAKAAELGFSREDAEHAWMAHWQLPSPQQGYAMRHRGIIETDDELEQLLTSLDYVPYWRDKLMQLNHLVPGRIDLRRMFKANVIDREEVRQGYIRLGYSPEDAETLTVFTEREKTQGSADRDLTKSEILALYAGGITTEAETRGWLTEMGYDSAEVDALLNLSEARRMAQFARAAVAKIHTLYVAHRLTTTEATTDLDQLGIDPTARDDLIELWTIERDANMRDLTQAQVIAALKKSVITGNVAHAKLMQLGYSDQDARIVISSIGGDFGGPGQLEQQLSSI